MASIPTDADEEPPGSGPAHWKFGTTADVGLGARGKDPEELFAQLGQGLTELITDLKLVRAREERSWTVRSSTVEGLVVAYLTELVVAFDEEGFLGASFDVSLDGRPPTALTVKVQGETYDVLRHPIHVLVKAVTLHRLQVDLARGRARVVVDI